MGNFDFGAYVKEWFDNPIIIFLIFMIIVLICWDRFVGKNSPVGFSFSGRVLLGIFGGLLIISFLYGILVKSNFGVDEENTLEYAIENDYTFYLDGEEIDEKKIDPEQYEFSIDGEKQTVYMTQKEDDTVFPIVIPFR